MLGGQQVQELAFSWKPMVVHLAGLVRGFSQTLLGLDLLDWIVCPRWRCLRWRPVGRGELVSTGIFTKLNEINQGMHRHTCELSGVGLRRFKVFLATTFLTAVLVLVGTREAANSGVTLLLKADFGEIGWFCIMTEAANSEVALLLEADFGEIGWFCITTFFKGGEFLQKRTTGAGGKNSKGEPSSFVGSGPSSCCKETEQVTKRDHCELHQENSQVVVPVLQGCHIQHRAVSAMVPELS
jgi:hypothetical protein